MKNLFLTGDIGCGKSTAIAAALGEKLPKAGGFLTVRQRDDRGRVAAFLLKRPDGSEERVFLHWAENGYAMHMDAFDSFGVQLLEEACRADFVVLDEIGGFEVLSDGFMKALLNLLESDVPCIGVLKGDAPAGKMIQALGLGQAYKDRMDALRFSMNQRPDILLYRCGQYDPQGLRLAESWVREHCK